MRLVFRAFGNPAPQSVFFRRGQRLFRLRWRYEIIGIGGVDAMDQLALLRLSRCHGLFTVMIRDGTIALIQPQIGLAALFIEAVAAKALVREDGPDIAIELNPGLSRLCHAHAGEHEGEEADGIRAAHDGA